MFNDQILLSVLLLGGNAADLMRVDFKTVRVKVLWRLSIYNVIFKPLLLFSNIEIQVC